MGNSPASPFSGCGCNSQHEGYYVKNVRLAGEGSGVVTSTGKMFFVGDATDVLGRKIDLMPFNYPILPYIRGGVDAWRRAGAPTAFYTCCGGFALPNINP